MHVVLFSIFILSHDYRSDNIYITSLIFWGVLSKDEGSFFDASIKIKYR